MTTEQLSVSAANMPETVEGEAGTVRETEMRELGEDEAAALFATIRNSDPACLRFDIQLTSSPSEPSSFTAFGEGVSDTARPNYVRRYSGPTSVEE